MPGYGGTGGLFRSLFRFAMPLVKTVGQKLARSVGQKALEHGVGLASDALKGKNMKQAIKRRLAQTVGEIKKSKPTPVPVIRRKNIKQNRRSRPQRRKNGGKPQDQDIFA